MHINKIDTFIDSNLDNFLRDVIGSKKFSSITRTFSKQDDTIYSLLKGYFANIDQKEVQKIVGPENVTQVTDIVKRYLALYLFLYLGLLDNNQERFADQLIKTTSSSKRVDIPNFYTSESNALVMQYYVSAHRINELANMENLDKVEETIQANMDKYREVAIFINDIGFEYFSMLKGNKPINYHGLLKGLIFRRIYLTTEKKLVFDILFQKEVQNVESKFIEIVVPKLEYVDFSSVESLLSVREIRMGYSDDLYSMIVEHEELIGKKGISNDEKVLELFNQKIVLPILEDFMRYHRDTERYDKFADKKEKKKESTKIKYVVTKLNRFSDYFSKRVQRNKKAKSDLERNLFKPLEYRRAVIVNELEELRIIDKLRNIGRTAITGNEFYSDLISFRQYPYLNFRDFQKYGFSSRLNQTVTALRSVNFEYLHKPRFNLKNKDIQWRVGGKGQKVNVVGVFIPNSQKPIFCMKLKETSDIRRNGPNGYRHFSKFVQQRLDKESKIKSNRGIYWLFDINKDRVFMDKYEEVGTMNYEEASKLLVAKIYDDILNNMYQRVIGEISQNKEFTFYDSFKLLHEYENTLLTIPRFTDLYHDFERDVFYKFSKVVDTGFDQNENIIAGLYGKIIKLPVIEKVKQQKSIALIKEAEIVEDESDIYNIATCQHEITWIEIMRLRRRDPNKFNQLIFEFIKKYVTENKEGDYICRSCNYMVNIKKYIAPREYSEAITISLAASVPLSEIREYEKYSLSIKNIDKMIERLCSITGMLFYVGSQAEVKLRRQEVTKEMIDMILIHNKTLRSTDYAKRRQRGEQAQKVYGINPSISNFFYFDLENSIFIYSSQETDKYKKIKLNNILSYIVFAIINRMSLSQITYLNFDKVCNLFLFEKYGMNLFEGLYIRINDKNDITELKNYKLLCYVIYYYSCMISKFGMWHHRGSEEQSQKKRKLDPQVQRIIIHTLVDLINSFLEVNTRKDKHYLYEVICTKFFAKLNSVYSDTEIFKRLREIIQMNISVDKDTKKIKFVSRVIPGITLDKPPGFGYDLWKLNRCFTYKHHITKTYPKLEPQQVLGKKYDSLVKQFQMSNYHKLAEYYTLDGERRKDPITKTQLEKIKVQDLEKMKDKVLKKKEKERQTEMNNRKQVEEYQEKEKDKLNKFYQRLSSQFSKENIHIGKVIGRFINSLEDVIGTNININNKNIYLKFDTYVIDHNHLGNKRKKDDLIIVDRTIQLQTRRDDPFFKTDVVYYQNKSIKTDIYYDAFTLNLLGYQEQNKDFVNLGTNSNYLKIISSISKKIRHMGFPRRYIEHQEGKSEREEVSQIIRDRIVKLKQILGQVQKMVYQLKHRYSKYDAPKVIEIYLQKIKKLVTEKEGDKVFKHWKKVNSTVFFKPISKEIKTKVYHGYFDVVDITKIGSDADLIVYYILQEFEKLIKFNTDRYTKTQVAYLIINIVEYIHKLYFDDTVDDQIYKFKYLLQVTGSYYDTEIKDYSSEPDVRDEVGEYDYDAIQEEGYDDQARMDALDIEMDENDMGGEFADGDVVTAMETLD